MNIRTPLATQYSYFIHSNDFASYLYFALFTSMLKIAGPHTWLEQQECIEDCGRVLYIFDSFLFFR